LPIARTIAARASSSDNVRFSSLPMSEKRHWSQPLMATSVDHVPSGPMKMKR
jgi:hypothetical protein